MVHSETAVNTTQNEKMQVVSENRYTINMQSARVSPINNTKVFGIKHRKTLPSTSTSFGEKFYLFCAPYLSTFLS